MRKHNSAFDWCRTRIGDVALEILSRPMERDRYRLHTSRLWWAAAIVGVFYFKDAKHAIEFKLRFSK